MNDENREALSERNRRRANCTKCGGTVRYEEGKASDTDRFGGIVYAVCGACGQVVATKRKPQQEV